MIHSFRFVLTRPILRRLSDLAKDKRGVSAVEFALVLPLMLTMFFGGVEVSQGISIDRKVTLTARTVADLVSRVATINTAGVDAALGASATILAPYPIDNAKITVSVVKIDANGTATIVWSNAKNGAAHAPGSGVTVPLALKTPNTFLVWGEASYSYAPTIGYVLTGTMPLTDQIFMRPRLSETVTKT